MESLAFEKYEGLGNDFVLVEIEHEDVITPTLARRLCDRRRGVGADGVLVLLPATSADAVAKMRVLNADGSIPEMCGNGLRCAALHLVRRSDPASDATRTIVVETDAGLRRCDVRREPPSARALVTVAMGRIALGEPVDIDVQGEPWRFWTADAGNPHAITTHEASREQIERLGAEVERLAAFPNGTNVEFATYRDVEVDLTVWERGVGVTLACGTGACATVALGVARGWLPPDSPVAVHLPGGTLTVTVAADGPVTMSGPARRVFSGTIRDSLGGAGHG